MSRVELLGLVEIYNMKTLFIFPKRGLYSLTKCSDCGYIFDCDHCDAHLVTYRKWEKNLELVCHQCQSYYNYPLDCLKCHSNDISSVSGGIDELVEILETETQLPVYRYDTLKRVKDKGVQTICGVTTRIYDPSIPYTYYTNIVFIQAHNLLASPDYLVQEEIHKAILELMLSIKQETTITFDTNSPDLDLFEDLARLNKDVENLISMQEWHTKFLNNENKNRELFDFPPYKNLLLVTSHEKTRELSLEKMQSIEREVKKYIQAGILPDLTVSNPYQSRFLRRKGMYSFHVLIRYPRRYEHIGALRKEIMSLASMFSVQVRNNPRHVF